MILPFCISEKKNPKILGNVTQKHVIFWHVSLKGPVFSKLLWGVPPISFGHWSLMFSFSKLSSLWKIFQEGPSNLLTIGRYPFAHIKAVLKHLAEKKRDIKGYPNYGALCFLLLKLTKPLTVCRGSATDHVLYFKCHRKCYNGSASENTDLNIFCDTC